nr:hypothetical protein [Tanacetum cinerariifolium]
MNEAMKVVVQLQSDRLKDEAQVEYDDFLNKLDENIRKIINEQVKEQVKEQVSKILPKIEKTSASEYAQVEEPMHTTKDLEEPAHQEFDTGATEDQLLKRPLSILTGFRHKQNLQLLIVLGTSLCLVLMDLFNLGSAIWLGKMTLVPRLMN